MKNIDGYVTKDSLYRLLSNMRMNREIDENASSKVAQAVADMKPVEVQPVKHGRWILCDDGYVRCSECNCKAFIENDETILTDFCHGCGANMRMGGDSE